MLLLPPKWRVCGGLLLAAACLETRLPAQQALPPLPTERGLPVLPGSGFQEAGPGTTVARPTSEPSSTLPLPQSVFSPVETVPGTVPTGPVLTVTASGETVCDCERCRAGRLRAWQARRKAHCQEHICGYPQEYLRPGLGQAMQGTLEAQKRAGRAARLALYEFDFVPGSDELRPRGLQQLARIAQWIPSTPGEVLIEPSAHGPELDEARRARVWQLLSGTPGGVPPEGVRVARPTVNGLDSVTGLLIESTRRAQTAGRGSAGGVGGGGATGGGTGASGGSILGDN